MQTSPLLTQLMEALRCLPGVGPKSAQRMAFTLLQRDRSGGMRLAQALTRAMSEIGHCADCRTFTEQEVCNICSNPRRQENGQICVVESPADIYAIEQTGQYSGRYFVLMGHLSPLDGIGPDDIGLDRLEQRLEAESISELILATNPTVEGEATANYIAELCAQYGVDANRYAVGDAAGNGRRHHAVALTGRAPQDYFLNKWRRRSLPPLEISRTYPHLLPNTLFPLIINGIVEVDLHERTRNPWFPVRSETASAPDDPFSLFQQRNLPARAHLQRLGCGG